MANPKDDIAFSRVVNVPPRGLGKTSLDHLAERARALGLPLLAMARQASAVPGLKDKAARGLRDFGLLMDELTALRDHTAEEVIRKLLTLTGYRDYLAADAKGDGEDRLANLDELVSAAREFDREHPGASVARLHGGDQPGLGRRPLEGRGRRGHPDDAARRQGAGVPGRLHRRAGAGAPAPLAVPTRTSTSWRRSAGSCSSGSPAPSASST